MTTLCRRLLPKILKCHPSIYIYTRSAVDLAHKVHGQKPSESQGIPVIVLHGLLGSKRNWDSMCKKINTTTQRTVVAVDARNHGESPHTSSHTYPDLAGDVAQLIDRLAIRQAVVVGHSMGGRTAMVLALTEPAKIHSLVVVDISPVSTAGILNDFFPKLMSAMKSVDFSSLDNVSKGKKAATDKFISTGLVDSAEGLGFILMNIGKRQSNKIGWMCNVDALNEYFTSIATFPQEMNGKKFNGPVLFIGGDQSNYIPPSDLDGIRNFFPNVELTYVKGVGHNVHAEDPASFFNLVNQFLSKNA